MDENDGNVVELDLERKKKQRRYDELKAAKPKPGSDDWKELMLLGRTLSGRTGGRRNPDHEARRRVQADAEKKLAGLYEDAYKVIKTQLDVYLAGSDIVCDECSHVMHIDLGRGSADALKAAMRVIDQKEGKAAQTVRQENVEVKEIRFVTAAAPAESA